MKIYPPNNPASDPDGIAWDRFPKNYGHPQWQDRLGFSAAIFHGLELLATSDGSWRVYLDGTHRVSDIEQVLAASLEEAKQRATAAAINLLLWAEARHKDNPTTK